jgi:imidazolonepropionase-like amidohydrolase
VQAFVVEPLMALEEVGTLEQSKFADLMIVIGYPLEDIRVLQSQRKLRVFNDGLEVTAERHRSQSDSPQFTPSPISA